MWLRFARSLLVATAAAACAVYDPSLLTGTVAGASASDTIGAGGTTSGSSGEGGTSATGTAGSTGEDGAGGAAGGSLGGPSGAGGIGGATGGAGTTGAGGAPADAGRGEIDAGCAGESDAAFCARLGKNCGSVTASDNCGMQRTVANCGACTAPQSCAGSGTANVCGGVYLCAGGSVSSSDPNTANPAEADARAFDRDVSTKWVAPRSPTPNITYQFAGASSQVVKSYSIGTGNDFPTRDPMDWRLEGSNDGTIWNTVDTQTGQMFAARNTLYPYVISNMNAYNRYRLNVTAGNGASLCQISELQLFGY
jgi:hypothetical protein